MKKYRFSDRQLLFLYFLSLISLGVFFLSLPFSYKNGQPVYWIDRLFTAVSAVCVTGLATFPTGDLSRIGQVFLLILIQAGGLGYVTFTTLFLFFPGARFSLRDSSIIQQYFGENQVLQPRRIMLNILGFTFGLECLGAIILYPGMVRQGVAAPGFSSVFHGISAFCNAGFSLYPDSLTRFSGNSLVLGGVSLMIVTGGLGFMVLWNLGKKLRHGKSVRLMYHTRLMLVLTPLFILGGFVFFLIQERFGLLEGYSGKDAVWAALFQSITTRTAGFNTIDQSQLSQPSLMVTLLLMITGGGSGSTAGGLKVSTVFLLALILTKGVDDYGEVSFLKRRISRDQLNRAGFYLMKAIMILFFSILLVALVEESRWGSGFTLTQIVYECVSALGTVGLSMGITADLQVLSKLILIFTMFAGRVALFAIIMPQVYDTEVQRYIRYPKGEVLIG
jgi:trk system potassium uptake protein TrkH